MSAMQFSAHQVQVGQEVHPVSKMATLEVSQMYEGWPRIKGLHTDPDVAKLAGHPSPAMQGTQAISYVSQMCFRFFGRGWVQGGRLEMDLVKWIRMPQRVTARGVVRDKVTEGQFVRVHLDVWIEGEDGEKLQVGKASGLLPTEDVSDGEWWPSV